MYAKDDETQLVRGLAHLHNLRAFLLFKLNNIDIIRVSKIQFGVHSDDSMDIV